MASSPLPLELAENLLAGLQKSRYVGLSALVMLVWDHCEPTSCIFEMIVSLNVSFSTHPVVSFDQEVSPINLICEVLEIQYVTRWSIFG